MPFRFLFRLATGFRLHLSRALAWNLQGLTVADREQKQLEAAGIDAPDLQRYAVWRRSTLYLVSVPTSLSAVLATVDTVNRGVASLNHFGELLTVIATLVLYAMPLSALAAARNWSRLRRSHRILRWGWAIAFLPPFFMALVPMDWLFVAGPPEQQAERRFALAVLDMFNGLFLFCTLLPTALALLPGLIRACLRVKTLLPGSIVPGWFLVAGAPFSVLLWLVALIALNHLAGNPLLIAGVLLWIGAPLIYVLRAELFVQPVPASACAKIGRVQLVVSMVTGLAVVLLCIYLGTRHILGLPLIGLHEHSSALWLWRHTAPEDLDPVTIFRQSRSWFYLWDIDNFQMAIEYVSRSLFLTVVIADLLLLMNLSVWWQQK
ncbi:MAG: hypothetical protein JNM56_24530, partial [Planctomycetia bacterium]|nr:hypothetical protein [Planctomycetia bacterium]